MERKLATVLFVDLVDSTALVSAEDPEVVRRRVTRYFERAAHCIEQHGGTVEKFAGDAVMAAFGVPRAHEDDAERAVRAAFAVLDAVRELGLEARIGVEAGEVVVEDGDSTFATGEAVNVAARLQQAGLPGEIVLGPGARRLAAGAVEAEDRGPLQLRGRSEPIWTWRAVRVVDRERRRQVAVPFVGREPELELLHNTFGRAVRDRRAQLVTVFGEPGAGKSRLVTEFTDGVERATVLTGRALPYGEGVTYWPLATMIKASAGITDDDPAAAAFDKLRTSCESDAVADLLGAALGVLGAAEGGHSSSEELTWAALQWAEQLADAQPLVLVFEDVQFADERLLDLVEHLARALRTVPVLIVCVARPDLLDARATWGGGNPRATAIELGALDPEESELLADALDVPEDARSLVLMKAEGNPLFLEETARMLAESDRRSGIPDSVQALIAARIDALDPEQKELLQRAATIGRAFWQGALERLAPELDVPRLLEALLDRQLVVAEERSTITGDRALRFKHVLIRDVAYSSTSKARRAEDHRTFAQWLTERAPDELVEIRAYHLDQSATLLAELDGAVPDELAAEAAAALEAAGQRALTREANRSARRLFVRAAQLEPTLWRRAWAAAAAFRLTELDVAAAEYEPLLEEARAAGDEPLEGLALLGLAEIALERDADATGARRLADEAVGKVDPSDLRARYYAHAVLARVGWWIGDLSLARPNVEAMRRLAGELGVRELESFAHLELSRIHSQLGDHDDAARELELAEGLAEQTGMVSPRAHIDATKGARALEAGDAAAAEQAYSSAVAAFEEAGMSARVAWALNHLADARLALGDVSGAENALRAALRTVVPLGERGYRVESERKLAELLVDRGRIDEAERMAVTARRTVGERDVWSQASSAYALARVRERQGRRDEAEALLRGALEVLEGTDFAGGRLEQQIRALLDATVTAPAPF